MYQAIKIINRKPLQNLIAHDKEVYNLFATSLQSTNISMLVMDCQLLYRNLVNEKGLPEVFVQRSSY